MKDLSKKNIIYSLSDPENGIVKYIGKTSKTLDKRLSSHISDAKYRKKTNARLSWIKSLINKGLEPKIEELDIVNESIADIIEIYWISQFKAWGFLLKNGTEGGEGIFMSKEIREKISINCKNKKRSQATKDKISKAKKNTMLGKNNHRFNTNCNSKVIIQLSKSGEFIQEWKSALEAAESLKINNTNISQVCNGKRKSTGGFKWNFK